MSTGVDLDVVLLTCMELPSDQLMRRVAHDATPLAVYANAGGLVTPDAVRAVAQARRGDRAMLIAVVHHADCAAAASPATQEASSGAGAPAWSTVAVDATASVGRALRELCQQRRAAERGPCSGTGVRPRGTPAEHGLHGVGVSARFGGDLN